MVVSLALDVVEGMCYLHSKGIIHGDIKASNVLLKAIVVDGEQRAQAKIADFGTSVVLKDGKEVSKFFAGTPTHMAPEVLSTSTVSQVCPAAPGLCQNCMTCGQRWVAVICHSHARPARPCLDTVAAVRKSKAVVSVPP